MLNGKLDLVQAEAVGDLIDALAPAQATAALHQLDGGLSRRLAELREALIDIEALLGYEIDFPDEDDGPLPPERIAERLDAVRARIESLVTGAASGERLREGASLVLAGRPNAGKSSLFNALLGTDRALVTEVPGTTRDAIEAHTEFLGWPVRLVDTAGLWDSAERIDRMGVEVSRRYLSRGRSRACSVSKRAGRSAQTRRRSRRRSPRSWCAPRPIFMLHPRETSRSRW